MSIQSRIYSYTAKNDAYIKAFLLDSRFKVTQEGEVFTRVNTNGIGLLPNDEWRRCDIASGDGYRIVNLCLRKNGRRLRKKLRVHRIVYQAFIGELNYKMVVNHKDGNKWNNKPDNLEQIEPIENTHHALEVLGHNPIRNTVISYSIAEEIRLLSAQGISYSQLVAKFGISKGHISEIVNYKIWNKREEHETEQATPIPF